MTRTKKTKTKKKTAAKKAKKTIASKSAPAVKKQKPTAASPGFAEVFAALQSLLSPYEDRLAAKSPNAAYYFLQSLTPTYKKRPMSFAGVKAEKNYVSYHLVPVYASPELVRKISPELKKRMQGKGCFNFSQVDSSLFAELAVITEAGYKNFKERGWL